MRHHFIWGFYLDDRTPINLVTHAQESRLGNFESRYFWPENSCVCLSHLSLDLLQLSRYKIKKRQDKYILISNKNIKLRKNKLHYKPLSESGETHCQYDDKRKIPLKHDNIDELTALLPAIASWNKIDKINDFLNQSYPILTVNKEILIHTIAPGTRLELSRIEVNSEHYLSMSLESHSRQTLVNLVKLIIPGKTPQSYSDFLNNL